MMAVMRYSEKTLAEFMHAELGRLAQVLGYAVGLDDPGSYAQAVTEVRLRCGVEDLADAADVLYVRALARVEVWRRVCADLTALYDFSTEGASMRRRQMFINAQTNLAGAILLSLEHDPAYCIGRAPHGPLLGAKP